MVLAGTISGSHVQNAYRALLGGPLVVVDPGSDESDPFPFVPDRHAVSPTYSAVSDWMNMPLPTEA